MEYDIKYTVLEDLLEWYFYKSFKTSIKLWINEKG